VLAQITKLRIINLGKRSIALVLATREPDIPKLFIIKLS
jgi:hypothetical protein